MRLDFLIPGFSKCGTTSLCAFLSNHPEIYIPPMKEPNFFAHHFCKGWEWYESLFESADRDKLWGDGSTCYSAAEFEYQAYQRAFDRFPDLKVILIARDPIARLESSFRYMHHVGHEWGVSAADTIGETLKLLPNMIRDTLYWQRLSCLRGFVPDHRIHLMFLEDFNSNTAEELARCCRFLGVSDTFAFDGLGRIYNSGSRTLRDTAQMRWIRQTRVVRTCWNLLSTKHQNAIGTRIGLRKRFTEPVVWDRRAFNEIIDRIVPDARQFLKHAGKPIDFWPLRPEALEETPGETGQAERPAAA